MLFSLISWVVIEKGSSYENPAKTITDIWCWLAPVKFSHPHQMLNNNDDDDEDEEEYAQFFFQDSSVWFLGNVVVSSSSLNDHIKVPSLICVYQFM